VDDIRATWQLQVAIRTDSPLFSYIDENRQWTGYCFDVVEAIETSLEAMEEKPLTCDGYGLILPAADVQWQHTIGALL
jgi:hypothetical protein